RTDIERMAQVAVGAAGGDLAVLLHVPRGASAQEQARKHDQRAQRQGSPTGVRQPDAERRQGESQGDADAACQTRVVHGCASCRSSVGSRSIDLAASTTSCTEMRSMPSSGSRWRACEVWLSALRKTMVLDPKGPLRAGSVGP